MPRYNNIVYGVFCILENFKCREWDLVSPPARSVLLASRGSSTGRPHPTRLQYIEIMKAFENPIFRTKKGHPIGCPFSCGRWDLNPHDCNSHKILSLARLPVPTLPRTFHTQVRYYHQANKKSIRNLKKFTFFFTRFSRPLLTGSFHKIAIFIYVK